MNDLNHVEALRRSYLAVKAALPWLDVSVDENSRPAFPEHAKPRATAHAKAVLANAKMAGGLHALKAEQAIRLLRYAPAESGPLEALWPLLPKLAAAGIPLVIRHTNLAFPRLRELAHAHPGLTVVLESGPQKILYFIGQVSDLLAACDNVFLSTYNFCNWLGVEQLCAKGLGHKLLYGSHWPEHDPDVAMGPIVMAHLPWAAKCDIAGNNLRRLLGVAPQYPAEVHFTPPPPFIIDAHGHNVDSGVASPYDFPVPDERMEPPAWTEFMDRVAVDSLFTVPARALWFPDESGRDGSRKLRRHAPARFRYFEVCHPAGDAAHWRRLEQALTDPACVGIKIHPTQHGTEADADAYAPVFDLASRYAKPILTHSWEISAHNPRQHLSHPDRFRRHLERHPEVRLVLGHAGGRPSTIEAVASLCRDFPNVMVDLAGDYFDNAVVETLGKRLGVSRVLFASDMDWIDPRCMLGAVLGAAIGDEDALRILRLNALAFFDS